MALNGREALLRSYQFESLNEFEIMEGIHSVDEIMINGFKAYGSWRKRFYLVLCALYRVPEVMLEVKMAEVNILIIEDNKEIAAF